MAAGKLALETARFDDALRAFAAALALLPGDAEAKAGQKEAEARRTALEDRKKRESAFDKAIAAARTALARKRYRAALANLEAALRLFPDDRDTQRALRDARETFKKVRAEYKGLLARADAARRGNRLAEARRLYADAAALWPEDARAVKGQREMEDLAERQRNAGFDYLRLMGAGSRALAAGRYSEAATAYAAALELAPGDVDAAAGLRAARAGLARLAKVKAQFDKLMRAGSNALGRRLYADAEKAFSAALRLSPDNALATAGLNKARYGRFMEEGRKAQLLNRRADAIRAYEAALEAKPGDATATLALKQARAMR
jgi:tetratricopeptide (TPR) repeat protein